MVSNQWPASPPGSSRWSVSTAGWGAVFCGSSRRWRALAMVYSCTYRRALSMPRATREAIADTTGTSASVNGSESPHR